MPLAPLLIVVGVLGLAIGSFLNVVIHRVPRDQSLVHPGSHCPACGHAVRPWHNVPVLGWLLLRGRCADCATPISARYPLVEAGTAVLFVAVAARFGWSWALPGYLYLAAVAIALALIDLDVMRLPDRIVRPSYPVAAALLVPAALLTGDPGALLRGALAAGLLYLIYRVLALWGMGRGDVKLAPLLGLHLGWLGWGAVAVGTLGAFLLGGLVAAVLLLVRAVGRKSRVPFGPYMLAGAFLAVFAATPITDWYAGLLMPATY
ncbi:prepilin peptidase [Actinoplanes teichomyceticus]|uniref:Leader peptidase (Prepilin peptidase)/N-methyltransferase n=1 Tax=Actinoplanes teichomyceticus TaxID=1867 RepID=A0A561VGU9_ACTTI|nr:A24 family peptidase [Actinoplanes teichomyceticus]TWG10794.1 leader peptidase (prepilin peptidase)/N-methyltransferase [Actinoplanes teichomyceticus]GIF12586.1 prepilin peptidase [Actinoplanes teichomyceticus]